MRSSSRSRKRGVNLKWIEPHCTTSTSLSVVCSGLSAYKLDAPDVLLFSVDVT